MNKKLTTEHRRKISEAIKLQHQTRDNYAMKGKRHTELTKTKMSISSKGKPKSKEHIKNWQKAMKELRANGKFKQWNKGLTSKEERIVCHLILHH